MVIGDSTYYRKIFMLRVDFPPSSITFLTSSSYCLQVRQAKSGISNGGKASILLLVHSAGSEKSLCNGNGTKEASRSKEMSHSESEPMLEAS
ncbi:hypothetical protein LEP1GSC047_2369 [Leptospira inadai serovar Lyme str. 10]|uniref:Uncharacterized protein n=2 Tax=Leptospira inadai serovar Lyme TaxID=293084 RepID=V6HDY4_9LEPT|nr:hypothetical protein LEP1GSC047_2369 [Leptospira inadai serovar Lyme str. 10]PNV72391.1 hypothetical protein BES34_019390 [Leptospira inadai serovar Lyme]